MKKIDSKIKYWIVAVVLFWSTTLFANIVDFSLGVSTIPQVLINILSPFVIYLAIMGITGFSKSDKVFRRNVLLVNLVFTILLISNVYYYREFTDFLTVDTIIKSGAVMGGMTGSTLRMMNWYDIVYLINVIVLLVYNIRHRKENFTKELKLNKWKLGGIGTSVGILVSMGTLMFAEMDRPELLTRGFDNKYIVKYLGLPSQLTKSGIQTYQINQKRALADSNGVEETMGYIHENDTSKNELFGKAKGKNVVYIHLESFQQFLVNYKILDEEGTEHEVTPNINKLYNSDSSLSFDNYYHQVSQGKTSDAEMMIENGLFGSKQGSAMVKYGKDNEFISAPHILNSLDKYETSVFHGNTATFWNRNNAYKSFGYDNFFSLEHYKNQDIYGYGLRDEDFFKESKEMYDKIDSPKYSKFIPVSHHFPYKYDMFDTDFPNVGTADETINGYFITANYMDREIGKFIDSFSDEERKNTVFILYGDHYGISNSRNKELGKFFAKQEALRNNVEFNEEDYTWDKINNTLLQKVPLIISLEGSDLGKDGINHTVGGQIDTMSTLLNLMGYEDLNLMQVGQDLVSKDNFVTFRDGTIVTDKYIIKEDTVWDINTKELIEDITPYEEEINNLKERRDKQLYYSDKIMDENLQKLYTGKIPSVERDKISYSIK